jgi:deoxyribodipyrimidine photolyase-related protein
MSDQTCRRVFLVLGNQLFPPSHLRRWQSALFFMAEDYESCTYVRHHKHKLILTLSAMRAHAEQLRADGFRVNYVKLGGEQDRLNYTDKLRRLLSRTGFQEIIHFEIEDKSMERRIERFARRYRLRRTVLPTPMFMCPRDDFRGWLDGAQQPRMADFYRWQRRERGILLDGAGKPLGGRWSHDRDNRKRLPAAMPVPELPTLKRTRHVRDVSQLVDTRFAGHPGAVEDFWLPTTRAQARSWFGDFLEQRFVCFGDYEDALTSRSDAVFHSALSPLLNIGLLTPDEVITRSLAFADDERIPVNSLEGFVRQIIGWREFIRGMYQNFGAKMVRRNYWNHQRGITEDWYAGTTGLPPLDDVIRKVNRLGWAHHIERLMVVGNLMLLCEIEPRQAYRWFMEMFVDSANWVMVPNVYGMALFSDGGIFTTKPYICGSNYLLRMGDYPRGDWTGAMDGLFWRFVGRHRAFFQKQPRLAMITGNLERMSPERRARLGQRADLFLRDNTIVDREVA